MDACASKSNLGSVIFSCIAHKQRRLVSLYIVRHTRVLLACRHTRHPPLSLSLSLLLDALDPPMSTLQDMSDQLAHSTIAARPIAWH
jgi:hypothetical protein